MMQAPRAPKTVDPRENYLNFKPAVDVAAKWWADQLRSPQTSEHAEAMGLAALVTHNLSKKLPCASESQIGTFEKELNRILLDELKEMPAYRYGGLMLHTNSGWGPLLCEAIEISGLKRAPNARLPHQAHMLIALDSVTVVRTPGATTEVLMSPSAANNFLNEICREYRSLLR